MGPRPLRTWAESDAIPGEGGADGSGLAAFGLIEQQTGQARDPGDLTPHRRRELAAMTPGLGPVLPLPQPPVGRFAHVF
jgi:hypothetical protein